MVLLPRIFTCHAVRWPQLEVTRKLGLAMGFLALALPAVGQEQTQAVAAPAAGERSAPEEPATKRPQTLNIQFDEFAPRPSGADPLAGREWTQLTEITPLLDAEGKEEVLQLLRNAEEEADLKVMVITLDAAQIRGFPPVAMALLREKLALEEGAIIVTTNDQDSHLIAYTSLLEARLGKETLQRINQRAGAMARVALGDNERALSLVRTVVDTLKRHVQGTSVGSESSAEKLFAAKSDVILPEAEEPAEGAQGEDAVASTGTTAGAPIARASTATAPTQPVKPVRKLLPVVMSALGAGLLFIAATIAARLISGSLKRRRRRQLRNSGADSVVEPKNKDTQPGEMAGDSPAPQPDAEAERKGSGQVAVKPRVKEARAPRTRGEKPAAPSRDDEFQEYVANLAQLAQVNRAKPTTDPYDAQTELDRFTLQEIQLHYRALFKMMPPASRPGLAESLEKLLNLVETDGAKPDQPKY